MIFKEYTRLTKGTDVSQKMTSQLSIETIRVEFYEYHVKRIKH